MANSGRGSIAKTANGRYKARIRGLDGKEVARTFDKKGEANDWLDDQRDAMRRGTWVDPRKARVTFGQWAAQWQAGQVHLKASSALRYDVNLRNNVLPYFEDRPLDTITRADVQAWVVKLSGTLAASTVHVVYGLFRQIMTAAVEEPVIPSSPCRRVNLPAIPRDEVVIPAVDQLEAIAAALPATYRRVVPTCAGSGLRLGEAFGLTRDRVDLLRGVIVVDRQLPPTGADLIPTKSGTTRRVPVGAHTCRVLAAQLAEYPTPPDGLVFRSARGGHLARQSFDAAWHAAKAKIERAGLDVGDLGSVTLHTVRHFYASLLIRQGLSVTAVAKVLGHKDPTVTLRTYAHLWPDDDDRVRAAVDEVLDDEDDDETGGLRAAEGGKP